MCDGAVLESKTAGTDGEPENQLKERFSWWPIEFNRLFHLPRRFTTSIICEPYDPVVTAVFSTLTSVYPEMNFSAEFYSVRVPVLNRGALANFTGGIYRTPVFPLTTDE